MRNRRLANTETRFGWRFAGLEITACLYPFGVPACLKRFKAHRAGIFASCPVRALCCRFFLHDLYHEDSYGRPAAEPCFWIRVCAPDFID